MYDFLIIDKDVKQTRDKGSVITISPDFRTAFSSKDLMIRGRDFYAVWDDESRLWVQDENVVCANIDKYLDDEARRIRNDPKNGDSTVVVKHVWDASSGMIDRWHRYVQKQMRDNYQELDKKIIFANTETKRDDYASKKLSYALADSGTKCPAYEEMISTLYDPIERTKLEWAVGSIVKGDSVDIQKFVVLYGEGGSGKTTFLDIVDSLFPIYTATFSSKELASANNSFAMDAFKDNPLIAIDNEGKLSRLEDNTKINALVSHDKTIVNVKYGGRFEQRFNGFIFIATNEPVKITDSKSGLLRRLIDVTPSGRRIPKRTYKKLKRQTKFELGAIARHCLERYEELGPDYYDDYVPFAMMSITNHFYNFVETYFFEFRDWDAVTLKNAWAMYKEYIEYAGIKYPFDMQAFKFELKAYFNNFDTDKSVVEEDGSRKHYRNYYSGFKTNKFRDSEDSDIQNMFEEEPDDEWLFFDCTESLFDIQFKDCPAQYSNGDGPLPRKWVNCVTKLCDIDTSKEHYVQLPKEVINIDFDFKNEKGEKDYERNLEEARKWTPTYAELSKSGGGIHLCYIYDGDVSELENRINDNIEIKIMNGNAALRRKLTKCNDIPIAHIGSGLPLKKGDKSVVNYDSFKSEKALRNFIVKCLKKEHHGATKPEVDYIYSKLESVYNSGLHYDVSDMRQAILTFAMSSTNQAEYCTKLVAKMKFHSDDISENKDYSGETPIMFWDVESYPNLFVVAYKVLDSPGRPTVLINPSPSDVESLFKYRLVGFNNRRYDNHMMYARSMGYSNEKLYQTSQHIINGEPGEMFGEAYNLSYTDIYDFSSKKQSLKKWEIELGIHHQEMGIPWDQPVPEELWTKVGEYCANDVMATEAVWHHLHEDWIAREILADISGLTVNDTTNMHTTRLIVGNDRKPQDKFVYTDLSEMFPGYEYKYGKSTYRGEEVGEGGYVYAEPGMYTDVALLDIASMHPNSAINLNIFGPYTKNFKQLVEARIAIKHKEYDRAGKMFDGKLAKYLKDESQATALAYALKIAINSVYGLTAAKFENKLKDPRNIDNIVAKRGALFMVNLKHEVQDRGFTVAHIKTDSIKIPNATPEIIQFVMDYGKEYGYTFEHEDTYDRMCLVNDAVYIAKYKKPHKDKKTGKDIWWTATGAQFAHPYVFKTLFSGDQIEFKDLCETKSVSTALYLDMNEGCPEDEHHYQFVGKVGSFCPMKKGGGLLCREKDGKYYAATGTKGYRWLEAEVVEKLGLEKDIDMSYFDKLADDSRNDISVYGDFNWFVSQVNMDFMNIPDTDEEELPFE